MLVPNALLILKGLLFVLIEFSPCASEVQQTTSSQFHRVSLLYIKLLLDSAGAVFTWNDKRLHWYILLLIIFTKKRKKQTNGNHYKSTEIYSTKTNCITQDSHVCFFVWVWKLLFAHAVSSHSTYISTHSSVLNLHAGFWHPSRSVSAPKPGLDSLIRLASTHIH